MLHEGGRTRLELRNGILGYRILCLFKLQLDARLGFGVMVSWVTTTGCDTIDLILMGLRNSLSASSFSFILDATAVKLPKPAPDIYRHALKRAGIGPDNAIAIEDTPESANAALSAGIKTVAFPGWAAAERRFPQGIKALDVLSAEALFNC